MDRDCPYEIYHSPMVWLPSSACDCLARERMRSYLPTIEYGHLKSWKDLDAPENVGSVQTIPRDLHIPGSLFTSSYLGCARWLSHSELDSELILHEWATRTGTETRYVVEHFDNRNRNNKIHKIAAKGVFSFDQSQNLLYFTSIGLLNRPQVYPLAWIHRYKGSQRTGMAVSQHGNYVAVWVQTLAEINIYLVNVHNNTHRLLKLLGTRAHSLHNPLVVCFSPDETLMGVSYSL